ncbi:MAG: hypothetical protein IPM96_21730 [Ignavibacteria bacterium]|nr:hypothetical protein [Ignavibacteria bacterium]
MTTQLNEGFRGHPAIGSVVMTEIPDNELPFKMLWDEMSDSKAFDIREYFSWVLFLEALGQLVSLSPGHKNVFKI